MRCRNMMSAVNVSVSKNDVEAFKHSWPCSGIASRAVWFTFDKRNGDLLDTNMKDDGPAAVALSQDAQAYAVKLGFLSPR